MGAERGLTRDSIRLPAEYDGKPMWLVDTAGWEPRALLDKKGKVASLGDLESKRSLNRAHVVMLVLDGEVYRHEGRMLRKEVAMCRRAVQEGKALFVVVNKADLAVKGQTIKGNKVIDWNWKELEDKLQDEVESWFPQVGRAPVLAVSALTGAGADLLLPAAADLYSRWDRRVSTARLNRWLLKMAVTHPKGGPSRVRYLTQVKARPPTFTAFLRGKGELSETDARQLTNALREDFGFDGIPLRVVPRHNNWEHHVAERSSPKPNHRKPAAQRKPWQSEQNRREKRKAGSENKTGPAAAATAGAEVNEYKKRGEKATKDTKDTREVAGESRQPLSGRERNELTMRKLATSKHKIKSTIREKKGQRRNLKAQRSRSHRISKANIGPIFE